MYTILIKPKMPVCPGTYFRRDEMTDSNNSGKGMLLMIAGLNGAIGSTVAAAVAMLGHRPDAVFPYLTTSGRLDFLGSPADIKVAGWDTNTAPVPEAIKSCGVLEKELWQNSLPFLEEIPLKPAPNPGLGLKEQAGHIMADMEEFKNQYPGMIPVFVNLLPAGPGHDLHSFSDFDQLMAYNGVVPPDIAYAAAAVKSLIPVVNFTPNDIEIPALINGAQKAGVPMCGKDGKTGQTYFKVVLASAFLARSLKVEGWYSLNILGNADGKNLMDPNRAACKLDNKTKVLDEVLGYSPGASRYSQSSHKVHIDYYPPRGDAKEAWDVIDFEGIFGLPMSMRVNLQGRDSVLAAPMILDLARWMAALAIAKRSGPVPELAFYFKKPVGSKAPKTFERQLAALDNLEKICKTS
jgi:myo-inositol-1-phosphate synthase